VEGSGGAEAPREGPPRNARLENVEDAFHALAVVPTRTIAPRVRRRGGEEAEDQGPESIGKTVARVDLTDVGWRRSSRLMEPSSSTNFSTGSSGSAGFPIGSKPSARRAGGTGETPLKAGRPSQ
jgi:hypothetical protein